MQSRNRPPESGGQRDRNAIARGAGSSRKTFRNALLEVLAMGTTPAIRATPRDSGGESGCPHRLERFSIASRQYESSSRLRVRSFSRQLVGIRVITSKVRNKRHLVLEKPFLNLNPLKDTPVHGAHFQSTPCEFDFDRSHVPP